MRVVIGAVLTGIVIVMAAAYMINAERFEVIANLWKLSLSIKIESPRKRVRLGRQKRGT